MVIRLIFALLALTLPCNAWATLLVGIGKSEITPPPGTPSAGYSERNGVGMLAVHDPLYSIALFLDNGHKRIVLCSVDHLGFTYSMVQEVKRRVYEKTHLNNCDIFIGSSHTHSGGGAFLDIPLVGEALAGPYNAQTTNFYIDQTVDAIVDAASNVQAAKVGIGYGHAADLSCYRGLFPPQVSPLSHVTVIKIVTLNNVPLAALFNYPLHPTVLPAENRQFSADFVGFTREHLKKLVGHMETSLLETSLYFNGAQGDVIPVIFDNQDRFHSCEMLGMSLATTVKEIWDKTETSDILEIETKNLKYSFNPKPTPFGLALPLENYDSEMNLIVLNRHHAFLTIPGELSTLYDRKFKEIGESVGFTHTSIFGLTNDAHGYIILPESWRNKTQESSLSFGGERYGELIEERITYLLNSLSPLKD